MRFKAVISLCKKAKQVVLCDHKGIQWIGDGAALSVKVENRCQETIS